MNPLTLAAIGTAAVAGLALATHDRRRLARLHAELAAAHHTATHDGLTGLPNRVGLAQTWPALAPYRPWVAVLDLDGFKPVNDTHGHAAGDAVLITVAGRLRSTVRGFAARLGGDEFAAVLLNGDPHTAARLAEVIAAPITLPNAVQVTVTASIGLAPSAGNLAAALADADAAMYRAKTARRAVAVYDRHRDDHTTPVGLRPALRVRDLTPDPVGVTA